MYRSQFQYSITNTVLENVKSLKDLGVAFDTHLMLGLHINDKRNQAYSILGVITISFTSPDKDSLVDFRYKVSLVQTHLEYANCKWSPYIVHV